MVAPLQLKLDDACAMGVNGSFAIADLQNQAHIKTEHLADGNFSITIKNNNAIMDSASNATAGNQQNHQPTK